MGGGRKEPIRQGVLEIHRLTDQGYVRTAELTREANEILSSPLLSSFQVPLAEIFE